MKKTNKITAALTAAIMGIGAGSYALAGNDGKNAAKRDAVNAAAVTMGDAIQRAEKEVGGKAIEADVDRKRGTYYYDVEIVTPDGTKKEVRIDMKTGDVVKVEKEGRG